MKEAIQERSHLHAVIVERISLAKGIYENMKECIPERTVMNANTVVKALV